MTHATLPTFRHGVHPPERKASTAALSVERMPFVERYIVPLSQHIGKAAVPLVKPGETVVRGQMLAKPDGFISTAVHAPVSGKILNLDLQPHPSGQLMQAFTIQADSFSAQTVDTQVPPDVDSLSIQETIQWVQNSGLVGLGGAAFPTHVKFSVPQGKRIQAVILNGCECEPYLTCDHRVMLEQPGNVVRGLRLMMRKLGAQKGYIGIESNKADAIDLLKNILSDQPDVEVVALNVKYPQGAEKMLLDAIFQKEVPSGKLPLDLEMVVNNVGTAAALAQYFDDGVPLIERVVTVTGPAVPEPKNLMVPLGTPLFEVLKHCAVDLERIRQVILGGPMMGFAQKNLQAPIIKGTSGILVFEQPLAEPIGELPCIRCSRCLDACPMFLNPSRLAAMVRREWTDELQQYHLMDCFECASCSYVCPSNIPLVHLMRLGKLMIRQAKAKEQVK
ncbi:MAG: electron transport complex subunit RsxC [Acidobacteria bacterium]|nr:electron transport complex subunit RsxC [Acidobacteriota bacterium]MCB9398019.1 electron transport complex subunit RsxC [Acidobacteriota bacterium]